MTDIREVIAQAIKDDCHILISDGYYGLAADSIIAALTEAGVLPLPSQEPKVRFLEKNNEA